MAKEKSSSQIPRLDGVSRIPLAGSSGIRPPSVIRSSFNLMQHRPVSFSGLKPPSTAFLMKRSNSGDRISNAANLLSRKTGAAIQKLIGKPEKSLKTAEPLHKETDHVANNTTKILNVDTTQPSLTRSDTFVRSSSRESLLDITRNMLTQSTPVTLKAEDSSTSLAMDNPNATHTITPFSSTITLKSIASETFNMPQPSNELGKTMHVNSTLDYLQQHVGTTMVISGEIINNETRVIEPLESVSPATNATYSNPGSVENMQMLEDVSIPSGFDLDVTIQSQPSVHDSLHEEAHDDQSSFSANLNETAVLAPDKNCMVLQLNSTMNTEKLIDVTSNCFSSVKYMQMLNITNELMNDTAIHKNTSDLLYMTPNHNPVSSSVSTTPDRSCRFLEDNRNRDGTYKLTPAPKHLLSPNLLKTARSDLILPIRTPDEDILDGTMNADTTLTAMGLCTDEFLGKHKNMQTNSAATSLQDINDPKLKKSRLSFGLDLTESMLDCSIELVDDSISSTFLSQPNAAQGCNIYKSHSSQQLQQQLKKQHSFEMDESLGILTPDQMKEFLDSSTTNNTNNLELPLVSNMNGSKLALHQMRIDQTPSPEELPLDPVAVRTDITDMVLIQQQQMSQMSQQSHLQSNSLCTEPVSLHSDAEVSKTDQLSKSTVSKISTSFITSVTSVTSLDTGYQGDGEMSRPASRGACDHSPSNGPGVRKSAHVSRQPSFNQALQPIRRQDPMTDSDFFTESDADDLLHRGDRRAQVIDGQLYGPMINSAASVFISEDPQMEDSCMESSGIFTDVENRCDEDLVQMRRQDSRDITDLSPDADIEGEDSTETVKSNRAKCDTAAFDATSISNHVQGQLSCSQTSSTIQSSLSTDRLSAATTLSNRTSYCSVDGSGANFDCKSFSSLEEALDDCVAASTKQNSKHTKSFTTGNTTRNDQQQHQQPTSVRKVSSPCKHASLTSNGSGHKAEIILPVFSNVELGTRSEFGNESEKIIGIGTTKYSPRNNTSPRGIKSITDLNIGGITPPRKTHPPNKWEAVMNKIANNKTLPKKNYNDVKSKVSTRVNMVNAVGASACITAGYSPKARRSPSNIGSTGLTSPNTNKFLNTNIKSTAVTRSQTPTDTGSKGSTSPQAKRLLQAATKRGRSFSKDSQKSSQSDLSLTSGSPKLLAKTPLRAAKKRDVRNLSISPTDLGPPPKTQQTANGSTRPKPAVVTLTQKRFTANGQSPASTPSATSTTASTPTGSATGSVSLKSSPPTKKHTVLTRRLELNAKIAAKKLPLKEQNRLIGSQQSIASLSKNSSKPETPTELQEISSNGIGIRRINKSSSSKNNNNNNVSSSAENTHTSSQSSSPILLGHGKKTLIADSAALLEKKSQTKGHSTRKLFFQKQKQQTCSTEDATANSTTSEYLDETELQQLKLLNRHSCNGRLDYESLERHLQQAEQQKELQNKSVEALGVMLQYLVDDLDAFACPSLKAENLAAKENLNKTLQLLEEARNSCTVLQEQFCEKEAYYTRREEELQTLHRCELEKAQENYLEFQKLAKAQISALEAKICDKDVEHKSLLECYRLEMEHKFSQKQQQLNSLQQQEKLLQEKLKSAESKEQELLNKISIDERNFNISLQAANEREQELKSLIKMLTKELEELRKRKDCKERELREELCLSQDEISVLRSSQKSFNESIRVGCYSPRNSSNASNTSISNSSVELMRLQSEADSLRSVLELKQMEISKLTKHNEELVRDADERAVLQGKISLLESSHEMLQSEVEIKSEKEKELLRQIDKLQKDYTHEKEKHIRFSCDNEQLKYRLKQTSELMNLLQSRLIEVSANDSLSSHNSSLSFNKSSLLLNGSAHSSSIQIEEGSPPSSPVIKGVIEKPDSVSWVLEIDDETPEATVSKIVKRAGSFRSVERSPAPRRQLSTSANANYYTSSNAASEDVAIRPNPLSQSLSAASVIRQHSSEMVIEQSKHRSQPRTRSKSVSVKSTEPGSTTSSSKMNKKLLRQNSGGQTRKNEPSSPTWNSSTPYSVSRTRTLMCNNPDNEINGDALFRTVNTASACKLITCDTSTLNSGEQLDVHSLPSYPSVREMKVLKNCQQIQESAGEAMVSGTNSEDEGCSASSDDIVSSASATSATSGSASSLNKTKNSHVSLEEVLLDKINSLNGTPMEMSWSDDAEVFTNASIV